MATNNISMYYILTNLSEINLYNDIKTCQELSTSKYYSSNLLVVLNTVTNILKGDYNQATTLEQLDAISLDALKESSVYWDNNYSTEICTEYINRVKELISDETTFNALSKKLITNANTKINSTLTEIYSNNNEITEEFNSLMDKINNTLANNEELSNKYASEVENINLTYTEHPDAEKLMQRTINIINGTETEEIKEEPAEVDKYIIIVGNKVPISKQITNVVNEINTLYGQLVNPNKAQAEIIYLQVLNDVISVYDEVSEDPTKSAMLETALTNNEAYNDASEEVKELVDQLFASELNPDNEYIYTDEDKAAIQEMITNATNRYNDIISSNANVQNEIDNKLTTLESLENEYKNTHDGEEYQHEDINNNQTQEGYYQDINAANTIYETELPHISEIIVDVDHLELTEGESSIINISFAPEVHKPMSHYTLTVSTENEENTATISDNTITYTGTVAGNDTITITLSSDIAEDLSKEINVVVNEMQQPTEYYFYLGNNENNSVISANYRVNTEGLQTYTDINDIIGTHNFDSAQYILMAEDWYNQVNFENALHYPLDANVYRVKIDELNYIIIEGYESWADCLIILTGNGGLNKTIIDKTEEETIEEYYWYAGTTAVDGNNYTSVASQVQTIPSSIEITLNNEYLYIIAPKTKTITVLDANTNAVANMKTYNQDTGTFTNAETFVGDYKIYKSAQDGLGRFIINAN